MADDVNLTTGLIFLILWSALAAVWWLIAAVLVVIGPRQRHSKTGATSTSLSVFKPIPPARDDAERKLLAEAIESFVIQLDDNDELLIGLDATAMPAWEHFFARWRSIRPDAHIKVFAQFKPSQLTNPKVAWMEILSAKAQGEFWLWSDADIIAPPDFLRTLKDKLIGTEANAVTAGYAVRHVSKAAGMFDALFVNVEFLPGAILLQRLGAKEFAYGAATMFRKTTFLERVNWADLGSQLADDHELGRRLSPVVVVDAIVSTFTLPGSWHDALQHYYRWQKTVRWCRPIGFAAVILVIPMIGWTTMLLWTGSRVALAGFAGQWLLEVFVGIIICSLIGCRLSPRTWSGLLLWPLVRMFSWLATWLPLRVIWGQEETAWYSPKKNK